MSFARPEALILLPLAAYFLYRLQSRNRSAWRYSDLHLLTVLPQRRAWLANRGGLLLRSLALLALILAVSGPRTPDLQTRLPVEGISIILVLDVSGSMATRDFHSSPADQPVSRLDAAKETFLRFVQGDKSAESTASTHRLPGRPHDQIGLVAFAAVPETICPLTLNHQALTAQLQKQEPKETLDAGTNIGDAMAEGLARLEATGNRKKIMILLSDGEHNIHESRENPALLPLQSANLARALAVPIYTIDCGGEPDTQTTVEDRERREDGRKVLHAVAEMTGGQAFSANSTEELAQVYQTIDTLERQPVLAYRYRRFHAYDGLCALAAIGFLGVSSLLLATVWRSWPW